MGIGAQDPGGGSRGSSGLPAATLFEMTASPLLAGIFLFFGPCPVAHGIFVPQPGMETRPPAMEAWSLNHWTTREAPGFLFL